MFALFSYSCESAQLTRLTMPSRLSCCSWFSLPRLVGFSGPQRRFAVLDTACISNAFICQRSLAEKCFVATVCLTHSLH